jgi:hypothetical protein
MSAKSCKIVIAPHVHRGPRATKRKSFAVSQQGWKQAIDHAQSGDTTIYLVCSDKKTRVATCTENNERTTGSMCKVDSDFVGRRKR